MLYDVDDFLINGTNIKPLGYQVYRQDVTTKKTNNPNNPVNSRYSTYQLKCSMVSDVVVFVLEYSMSHSLGTFMILKEK